MQTVGTLLDYIEPKYINGFWQIIHKTFENVLKDETKSLDEKAISVQNVLHFLGQSIEYHGGKKVVELEKIINLVIKIIDQDFPEDVMMTLSKIGALLLISKNFMLGQLEASRLSKKILCINHASVFESFVVNSIGYSQFDVLILPDFLRYYERNPSKSSLEILAKIVNQRAQNNLLESGNETEHYNINMKTKKSVEGIVSRVIKFKFDSADENELEEFLLAIQVLPHLMSFDKEKVGKHLAQQLKELCKSLKSELDYKNVYLLATLISSLHNFSGSISKSQTIEMIHIMLPLAQNENASFPTLKILRFLIETLDKSQLTQKLFEKIHETLIKYLLSPHHDIRLTTFQILSSFDHLEIAKIVDSDESMFTVFRKIEEVSSTIQTYRDQILLLQKLEHDSTYFQNIKDTKYFKDAVKFCFGFLNIKFQLLMEPTKNILESYMVGANLNDFWNIFKAQLIASINQNTESAECEEDITQNEFINNSFTNFITMTSNSYDPIAYRVKLWQVLSDSKSNIHDSKHRDIVELYFDFYNNEYKQEDELTEEAEKDAPKARQKLLIHHLQVLAKFNNPKCVYKTNELRQHYHEFLFHRNFVVQKLALDCIVQYKDDEVVTYKDILYNVLSEKTFRQELVALKLGEKIREDHRQGFVKVLLPILYSKMTIKANKKDQEGFKNKKEVIVRFMSNLKEDELVSLIDIATGKIASLIDMSDYGSMTEKLKSARNIKVNELQSMLHFLDLIRKHVAGLYSIDFQRKILNSVLAISCFTCNSDATMFKNLKQSCLSSLMEFFEQYDEYIWSEDEENLLFEVFVWNHLEEFHLHSSQNVSWLMKLFVTWSKNPKYYKLLDKSKDMENNALKSIMKLLSNRLTTNSVTECIMDLLERLLTLKLDDEVIEDINYGTRLVEPFVVEVLMKLKDSLTGSKVKALNQRNLLILSRITELVTDVASSKILLDILIPLTLKKSIEAQQDVEGIMQLMTTTSNLLKVVDNPSSYVKQLSPLFEQMQEVNHRKFLVKLFNQTMTHDTAELKSMVTDLNAYDRRWIEQPDFERRLSVFHRLEKIINTGTLSMEVAVIVIYHCFYYLKHEKDLAMRDNAGHFLKLICMKVITQCDGNKQQLDYFLDKIVLNLITKRIRDDPKVRTESIQLLGELAREHPTVHPVLSDLHPLTCAANRELDFFDNITHLQTFRHMKGLRKFPQVAESLQQVPNLRTLNDFLLPIGRMFLCTDEYKKKSKVIEAAIDYIAAICKLLPWNNYEMLLKFYIRKLKSETGYQKQLIKLIPAILESFHFDLSKADKTLIVTELPTDEDIEKEEENESESEEENEDIADVNVEPETARALEIITVLRQNIAQRVIKSLTRRLIPSLFRVITEISASAHKLNKETRRAKEKADMLKIPIAFPIIKLLQKLPSKFLEDYLSQVVLKVSSFLKSTLKQVRATARHTLKEIMIALGPSYLEQVLSNLKGMLSKGFQVHVLSVTVHTLLDVLKTQLTTSTVADKLAPVILNICIDDIFGKLSEEHEVDKIGRRTPEAKPSRKSFLSLHILAATISENCVIDVLTPFKNHLLETQSKKTVGKIQECLQKIVTGLTSNSKIPGDSLMILIHGTISESIFNLLPQTKKFEKKTKKIVNDSFIIAAEPKRRGATVANKLVKTSKQTNSYVLVEFGLELLHVMLKKKKFPGESFLNPLVPMLCDSLKSNYLKVNTLAVKCLSIMWSHQLELDNLKTSVTPIVSEIFGVLHKYATNQVSKKDNHFLLVKSAFKCVVVIMQKVDYYSISDTQLKALLLYVEQDLNSFEKDTMAFTLLNAIIGKMLMAPEIHEIMKKVAHMSITSESDEKRTAAKKIVLSYLMLYPLGKKVDSMMKFFIAQLNYEEISGRESAILMMMMIFQNFPVVRVTCSLFIIAGLICFFFFDSQVLLRKFSGLYFLSLGARLVNDDSPKCREKIAEALELLVTKLDSNPRQQLFEVVLLLLKDKKLSHREMAAQLIIRFVNAEGDEFEKRVATILPLLLQSITMIASDDDENEAAGKFVKVKKPRLEVEKENEEIDENAIDERDQQTIEDHHMIQTLNAIIRIFEFKPSLLKVEAFAATIDEIGYQAQHLLAHEHIWVRLRALQLINFIIKSLDFEVIEKVLLEEDDEEAKLREFLRSKKQFRSVVFDMAVQLKPDVDPDVLSAIIANLSEVSKIIKNVPFAGMVNDKKDFNLMWLIRRLRYAIHAEIASTPSCCLIRKSIFGYFDSLISIVDQKILSKLASSLLTSMLREIAEGEHGIEDLKPVALLVCNKIKNKIGLQEYDKIRLELQSKMLRKRVDRRKALAQEKINNPAKAATRTIVKQLKKQDMKKRKRQDIQEGIILPRKKKRIFGNGMSDTYE